MNYKEAIDLLTSQGKFHIKLGLERVQAVLKLLGNPQDKIKIIHVAGTNGKGSVCSIVANVLKCAGYKVGLYTSPHLVEYTERIRINNEEISQEVFSDYVQKICDLADKHEIHLTEFEILTVMAYKYFADNKVNIAVIETGLGGRFDATNVTKKTFISVITSISLDHTDRLGDTVEKIAFEKAGIIKPKSIVVTEISNKGFRIIRETAEKMNSKLVVSTNYVDMNTQNGKNYIAVNGGKYEFNLLGLYQKGNLSIVMKVLEQFKLSEEAIQEGFKTARWPARLEYFEKKNILVDGAHNPAAAIELKKSLDYYFPAQKRTYVYGTLNTKDYKEIANILFTPEDQIYYYEFNSKNAVSMEEYKQNLPNLNIHPYKEEILKQDGLKIVTGSLYMIGELYNEIKKEG